MPGVLKRSEDNNRASECSEVLTKLPRGKMSHESSKKAKADFHGREGERANGDVEVSKPQKNGLYEGMSDSHGFSAPGDGKITARLPPEIEHITLGFVPLSTLITRLVQETFNDLTDVINELSDLHVSQAAESRPSNHVNPQLNGIGIVGHSQGNVQKKLRLLNFTQDRRAQFIKILVLSQWSRQAEAVHKVIDLRLWLENQKQIYREAAAWVGELKRLLGPIKMPSPDLKTALRALSSGKASWLPDVRAFPSFF